MQNNIEEFKTKLAKAIATLKPETQEIELDRLSNEMCKCINDPFLLNEFLDILKDKNPFNKTLTILVLGKLKDNDNEMITKYLLTALSDKTTFEYCVGSSVANSMIRAGGAGTLMLGWMVAGFFAAGPIGGVLGGCFGYKSSKIGFKYANRIEDRVNAAKGLGNRGICTQEILNGLQERINDSYEHKTVKEAAQTALDQLLKSENALTVLNCAQTVT